MKIFLVGAEMSLTKRLGSGSFSQRSDPDSNQKWIRNTGFWDTDPFPRNQSNKGFSEKSKISVGVDEAVF